MGSHLYDERQRDTGALSAGVVPLIDDEPARLADRITEWVIEAGATALSVRFHLGWLKPDAIDAQIERFCAEVLPRIREAVAAASPVTSQ